MSSCEDVCANCGKKDGTGVKLKKCTSCHLVKYCSVNCQKAHRKRSIKRPARNAQRNWRTKSFMGVDSRGLRVTPARYALCRSHCEWRSTRYTKFAA
mmetsp:Transcript_3313/g.6597  ORF Transcript_3313/g.6597 Transcript_3313/m.6597 type:complete len:97 (+) Transcript_3313:84-374(+)